MAALSEQEELELLTLEREKAFSSTSGGAATGNPNLRRQGDRQVRDFGRMEPLIDIGGAAALGGVMVAVSPEILQAAGNAAGAIPGPAGSVIGGALKSTGAILKSGGRVIPAISGAISGASSETAGQVAETLGAGAGLAEGARIVGGFAGPGSVDLGVQGLKKYVLTPSFTVLSKFRKEAIRSALEKIDKEGMESLNVVEKRLIKSIQDDIRGGAKSDASLEAVGRSMEDSGAATVGLGNQVLNRTVSELDSVVPGKTAELSDIGARLREKIVGTNAKMKEANDALYKQNESARDAAVSLKERAGQFVNKIPEFEALTNDLRSQLAAGNRSPDVQKTYKYILGQLESGGTDTFGQQKPIKFQALDDIRRDLGEVFRGKPPEGYAAISAGDARKYYAQISDIQKKYAGDAQERLLDDYARGKEGLEPFISARGRKATALDRYDDSQFVTDPSKLPDAYFNSRTGVRALKQLTGDEKMVNEAAQQYVNRKLQGATADEADAFMRQNSDWLREVPMVRAQVETYAARRVVAERGVKQAQEFVKEATETNKALIGGRYPADRVRNLVQNGNMDLWEKAGPAIASSKDGRENILSAVRQVIAEKPMSPERFNRTIRPALKSSGLADDAAMDLIESKLKAIVDKNIPEAEKLGMYRRIALQATAGYSASGMARGSVEAAKSVPD